VLAEVNNFIYTASDVIYTFAIHFNIVVEFIQSECITEKRKKFYILS